MTNQPKRNPRADFRVAVGVEHESRLQKFYSRNLSSGGIFLEVAGKPPAIGSKLKITFEVAELSRTISAEAQVIHHHPYEEMDDNLKTVKKTGIGLRFLKLEPKDQELINDYVKGKDLRVTN